MHPTVITENKSYLIVKGTTNESITAVYLPADVGAATITLVAQTKEGAELPIPDGAITESTAAFTGRDVPLFAVITGYTTPFTIYTAQ